MGASGVSYCNEGESIWDWSFILTDQKEFSVKRGFYDLALFPGLLGNLQKSKCIWTDIIKHDGSLWPRVITSHLSSRGALLSLSLRSLHQHCTLSSHPSSFLISLHYTSLQRSSLTFLTEQRPSEPLWLRNLADEHLKSTFSSSALRAAQTYLVANESSWMDLYSNNSIPDPELWGSSV